MSSQYKQSFKNSSIENADLSIYNCGLQSCDANYTWGPGVRDHFLIHLVTKGAGRYQLEDSSHAIAAGDLFLSKPGQRICYIADTADPWEYYWVGFNGASASKLVQRLPFADDMPVHHAPQLPQTQHLLHNIFLATGPEPCDEACMTGHLYLFLSHLMQQSSRASHPPDTGSQYVVGAIKFIQFNYSRDISINDVAFAVGVSRSHLYRVFVQNIGRSPVEYLTEYRINEACRLIETTSLPISEIATSVGFFDQFYFSRVFKKTKGMPPSRYKENL